MGTAYEHGAMAGLPTVTLANHTSILTGRAARATTGSSTTPGSTARTGEQIITNSHGDLAERDGAPSSPGVESIHDAVHRTWPDAFTASVNEPCDIGADYSTFDFFRRGEVPPIPTDPDGLPHTTERFVRPSKDYSWSSIVDHMGIEQAVGIWSGHYRDVDYPLPRFMWCNFTLTDSAMHEGGPHSEIAAASVRDSDARLGEVLAAVERAGVFDETAFVLVADHGMEESDPEVRGDWDVAPARGRPRPSATRATASSTSASRPGSPPSTTSRRRPRFSTASPGSPRSCARSTSLRSRGRPLVLQVREPPAHRLVQAPGRVPAHQRAPRTVRRW